MIKTTKSKQKPKRITPQLSPCQSPPSTDLLSLELGRYRRAAYLEFPDLFKVFLDARDRRWQYAELKEYRADNALQWEQLCSDLRHAREAVDAKRQKMCRTLRRAKDLAIGRGGRVYFRLARVLEHLARAIADRRMPCYSKRWDPAAWNRQFPFFDDVRLVLDSPSVSELALAGVLEQYGLEVVSPQQGAPVHEAEKSSEVVEEEFVRGWTVKTAGKVALEYIEKKNGGVWPGRNLLADAIKCPRPTLSKAINGKGKDATSLRTRRAEAEAKKPGGIRREVQLTKVHLDTLENPNAVKEEAEIRRIAAKEREGEITRLTAESRDDEQHEEHQHQRRCSRSVHSSE